MQRDLKKEPLRGVIPPMATLLLDDDHLDKEGTTQLIEHLIAGGVHGIFILGTTGECTNISYKLRRELITLTCEKVNGRVPVLVGITDTSLEESLALSRLSKEAGVTAVVAAPPYYYGLGESELITYFNKLAGSLPLPLYLYNMPSHTKTMMTQKVVLELAKHPNVYGLKDSSGQAVFFNAMIYAFRERPDFTLLVGPEEMMASTVLMGGNGGVSGGANIFPKLFVDLYNAADKGDLKEVSRLQEMVMEIADEIYAMGSYGSSFLKGLKASMSILGIGTGYLATPLSAFDKEEVENIRKKLVGLKAYKQYV